LQKKPQSQKSLWQPENKNFQFLKLSLAHLPTDGKGCEKEYFLVFELQRAFKAYRLMPARALKDFFTGFFYG